MNRFKSSIDVAITLSSDGVDYNLAVGSTIEEIVVAGPYENKTYANVKLVGIELADRPPFNPAAPVYDGVPCMGVVDDGIANMRDAAKMMQVKALGVELAEDDDVRVVVIPVDRIVAINGAIVSEDGSVVATVSDADGLKAALAAGGTVTLTDDVAITEKMNITANTTLNLNGKTISGSGIYNDTDGAKDWSLISVSGADVEVTVKGGTFQAEENDSYCIDICNGAKVTIKDGTFAGNITAIYVYEGELIVEGGEFSIQQLGTVPEAPYKYILNCYDANYAAGTAKIVVKGGKFHGFNPSLDVEGKGSSYLADGYKVVEESEGVFVVVPMDAE